MPIDKPRFPAAGCQAFGTCEDCGHYNPTESGLAGECRRYPPQRETDGETFYVMTERKAWCGEWVEVLKFTDDDERLLREEIPKDMIRVMPWLLEPMPFSSFAFGRAYKAMWPLAFHIYRFLVDFRRYGPTVAIYDCTPCFIASWPDGYHSKPFRVKTAHDSWLKERCRQVFDHLPKIFPNLVDTGDIKGLEASSTALSAEQEAEIEERNAIPVPLWDREDLFNNRSRKLLRRVNIASWEELVLSDYMTMANMKEVGVATLTHISKVAAENGFRIWGGETRTWDTA